MNQCWLGNNRSAKELLNRGSKPRVPHETFNNKPVSKSATSGSGSKCDCTTPCYNIARNHRAHTHCNTAMVRHHFVPLLKPTPELRQLVEGMGLTEHTESPDTLCSSNGIDTVECPNCNSVIDLEVVRAQETLKL